MTPFFGEYLHLASSVSSNEFFWEIYRHANFPTLAIVHVKHFMLYLYFRQRLRNIISDDFKSIPLSVFAFVCNTATF